MLVIWGLFVSCILELGVSMFQVSVSVRLITELACERTLRPRRGSVRARNGIEVDNLWQIVASAYLRSRGISQVSTPTSAAILESGKLFPDHGLAEARSSALYEGNSKTPKIVPLRVVDYQD